MLRKLNPDEIDMVLKQEDYAGVNNTLQELVLDENKGKSVYTNTPYPKVGKIIIK